MTTIDHTLEAESWLPDMVQSSFDQVRDGIAIAQVHATLALVAATEKQTAVLTLIFSAMQTGMTNHQRAELNQAVTA